MSETYSFTAEMSVEEFKRLFDSIPDIATRGPVTYKAVSHGLMISHGGASLRVISADRSSWWGVASAPPNIESFVELGFRDVLRAMVLANEDARSAVPPAAVPDRDGRWPRGTS
ncbi:hypothetical protein FBQ97_02210 [Acidobacteria bacterium ACD]|nr:hypothetical protein [Acidobacteria bacterium ACB2]MDL1948614.1 hypothetical protein [Acidobacteria bacterium ACD]